MVRKLCCDTCRMGAENGGPQMSNLGYVNCGIVQEKSQRPIAKCSAAR